MTSRFLNLPAELLLFIFSSLTPRELLACRNSCRRLRDIIRGDGLLQWRLQSLEHCMKDFLPLSSLTLDFLENLEEIGMASSTFSTGEEVSMHTEFERFRIFHNSRFSAIQRPIFFYDLDISYRCAKGRTRAGPIWISRPRMTSKDTCQILSGKASILRAMGQGVGRWMLIRI